MSLLAVSIFEASASVAEGGGVTVDMDASLVVQIGIFILLLVILKPLLFDPMLRLFEEREKKIDGTRRDATKEDERSAKALAKYEGIMAKAREAGNAERDQLRSEGQKKEAEILALVRGQTTATVENGRKAIAEEATTARTALETEANALGAAIASRVLGREVSP
jgi:F-type H+-transporting ATPase subunit b